MHHRLHGIFLLLALASVASAHFIFVVPETGGRAAQVILSEDLHPSQEVDAGMVAGAKLSLLNGSGQETPLEMTKGEHAYTVELAGSGTRLVHGTLDLGLQGEGRLHVLVYYPKTIVGDAFDSKMMVGSAAPVELVPVGKPGELRLKLLAHGKPLAKAEITVITPDGGAKKLMTGDSGETEALTAVGRYGAWARYWEDAGGTRDGKAYGQTRNYATLVFDAGPETASAATKFATMPEASSSFGAVASDGWLYVYGGHIAPTHSYSTKAVSGRFARLRLSGEPRWEELPGGPGLQGMNLAAYEGRIYRIGGMEPRNKPGEKEATFSVADCARFDPGTMKWEPLPALPAPRSSHDVVVIGSKLIVVGGWNLKGAQAAEWQDTLEILDLAAAKPEWKSAKQPFERRALIASGYQGKMYVMGGFDQNSKIVRETAIYDPGGDAWTKGPELPGGQINGFAPAACVHHGELYASVADGTVYRLAQDAWQKVSCATPRVAHRMASEGRALLVIGGAAHGKNFDLIEAVATP